MFDFTNKARKVLEVYAQAEGRRLNSDYIGPEHILLGMMKEIESIAIKIMHQLGVNFNILKANLDNRLNKKLSRSIILGNIPVNKQYIKIIDIAKEEAKKLNRSQVGTEHLLFALLLDNENECHEELKNSGLNYNSVRIECEKILNNNQNIGVKNDIKRKVQILDEYTLDLTKMARNNELDPVIGRKKEIDRIIRILGRKNKNNPVLIGEAGVGKTAIIEGLAQKIVNKEVPESLHNQKLLSLDMTSIVAGTKYRGEFEERLKRITNELINKNNIIIFIDELHTIMGAGAAEGAIDAANILKPFLARGNIQCIGATTFKEYKLHIEKDAALERRFQTVVVKEPTIEQTIEIINGLKPRYEKFHKVKYTNEAITLAVKLSTRYIHDRYLPDKAIDVIDEAGSKARIDNSSFPKDINILSDEIFDLNKKKNNFVQCQEYEKAAKLRDRVNEKKDILEIKKSNWLNKENEYRIVIDEDIINSIISQNVSVPIEKIEEEENKKLLKMEKYFHSKIIGQNKAVETICKSIRRSRIGLRPANRPIGVFLFVGATGVGKTELAKILAEFLFNSKDALIRIDMSEYMEKHSVSKLIGAPPGYVGYDDGGQLTQKIKRNPYSVILFDEVEKAHPDFINILLQLFAEGELTDNNGAKISFRDSIIIMTSNVGNSRYDKEVSPGFFTDEDYSNKNNEKIQKEINNNFNPEFINRIDEIVYFNKLSKNDIGYILNIMLNELNDYLSEKDIYIEYSSNLKIYLIEKGYSEKFGARYLRRTIQTEIEDNLALNILSGKIKEKSVIKAGIRTNSIYFNCIKRNPNKQTINT